MTTLPEHVTERVETMRIFRCQVCRARLSRGEPPARPDIAEQTLTEWVQRHAHDQTPK